MYILHMKECFGRHTPSPVPTPNIPKITVLNAGMPVEFAGMFSFKHNKTSFQDTGSKWDAAL